jgi:hypothetical protein
MNTCCTLIGYTRYSRGSRTALAASDCGLFRVTGAPTDDGLFTDLSLFINACTSSSNSSQREQGVVRLDSRVCVTLGHKRGHMTTGTFTQQLDLHGTLRTCPEWMRRLVHAAQGRIAVLRILQVRTFPGFRNSGLSACLHPRA